MLEDYDLITDWTLSPNGKYRFGSKEGKTYFIKELPSPVRPSSILPDEVRSRVMRSFEDEMDRIGRVIQAVNNASMRCPYIVAPTDIFVANNHLCIVSPKIDGRFLTPKEISEKDIDSIHELMIRFTEALRELQRQDVIHGDLKHSNVFVLDTPRGLEPQIIDFDDSYLENEIPPSESLIGSPEYYSPEMGNYIVNGRTNDLLRNRMTCKSDIFAAGIMFHEYLSGSRPMFDCCRYPYMMDDGEKITLDSGRNCQKYSGILRSMLTIDYTKRPDAEKLLMRMAGMDDSVVKTRIGSIGKEVTVERPTGTRRTAAKDVTIEYIIHSKDGNYYCVGSDGSRLKIPLVAANGMNRNYHIPIREE